MPPETQPEPPNTPQTPVTEADAQAARLVSERLNRLTRRATRANRFYYMRYYVLVGVFLATLLLPSGLWGLDFPLLFLLILPLFFLALILFLRADNARAKRMPGFDVAYITQLGGVKAITPLFAALQNPMPDAQRQTILDAMTRLLPQLKASDAPLITPALRRNIHTTLANASVTPTINDRYAARCIALLKALEQVGDSRDIPVVERLTKMKARTPGQEKIKRAAIECLPMLRANCGEVEAARTLLRASQSEPTDPDTLLRPASNSGQTGSAELLRGTDSPDAAGDSGG